MSAERDPHLDVDPETGQPFVRVAGGRVHVVSDAEAAQVDYVICSTTGYFPDDVHTMCAACGEGIVHRPYVPVGPPKICLRCALLVALQQTRSTA